MGQWKTLIILQEKYGNYDFEDMDPYQAYEYCQDENRFFIELTTNKENRLSQEEIFMALLGLLEINTN